MSNYGVYEAKTKLAELLRQVQEGKRVTITNRGEPVADLVPSGSRTEQQTVETIEQIKRIRTKSIDQSTFDKLRRRGRR